MSASTTPTTPALTHAGHGDNYLTHGKGILSWLLTIDHKRIAIMYLIGVLSAYVLGGIFALMLRAELAGPGQLFFPEETARSWNFYNQMFTLHGAVMVFLFIIPAIPAIIGNFVLPMMLGARDLAFPKLNLLSLYLWALGALFFVFLLLKGILNSWFPALAGFWGGGGLDTGWTFYTPYSTSTDTAVVSATLGAFILGFSSILTGLNFVATIHMMRPKGMNWFRMPLLLWALYGTSIIQILATPVLAITLLLLVAERTLGVGIFDPALGGDPVLYQHFFWFYSHPAVYIMILPALGVVGELVPVFCRKHIFGYNFIAISSIAIALLGFLVWGHHMFVSGQSPLANGVFSLLTFFVAVPSAIKTFNYVSTMYKANIQLRTPFFYACGMIFMFVIGGLTGLFLGALAVDVHVHDTYFVVAHFHYVMMGSMLFAFVGGLYYWFPKMFGKMPTENFGKVAWLVLFIGFNWTFFPQFVMGSQGMPRRYATYPEQFTNFHLNSTFGAFVMGFGLLLIGLHLGHALLRGRKAPANPWGANTLEWHTPSPPPHENFPEAPEADDPYNFRHWHYVSEEEGYVWQEQELEHPEGPQAQPQHAEPVKR